MSATVIWEVSRYSPQDKEKEREGDRENEQTFRLHGQLLPQKMNSSSHHVFLFLSLLFLLLWFATADI